MNEIIISDLQGELGIRDIKHFFLRENRASDIDVGSTTCGRIYKSNIYIYITYNNGFINPLTTFSLWISMDFNLK
jgi:hypothetical protein